MKTTIEEKKFEFTFDSDKHLDIWYEGKLVGWIDTKAKEILVCRDEVTVTLNNKEYSVFKMNEVKRDKK